MDANDVYNIANALPLEELHKLCSMLKIDLQSEIPKRNKKRKATVDFTVDDGIKYLIENYFHKVRKL
jgi:hypothetical protein